MVRLFSKPPSHNLSVLARRRNLHSHLLKAENKAANKRRHCLLGGARQPVLDSLNRPSAVSFPHLGVVSAPERRIELVVQESVDIPGQVPPGTQQLRMLDLGRGS